MQSVMVIIGLRAGLQRQSDVVIMVSRRLQLEAGLQVLSQSFVSAQSITEETGGVG